MRSKVKVGNKLTKKTRKYLNWDIKKCSHGYIKRIMKATLLENEII
jgi:hypothetical protein